MSRRPFIAGNWKMYTTVGEAVRLAEAVVRGVEDVQEADVVLCPPFVYLDAVGDVIRDSDVALGAQNLYWEPQGAFTGEVSAPMLSDIGCRYVIVGHSERRHVMGETDEEVSRKVRAALAHAVTPIVCVGETLAQRNAGDTLDVVGQQVRAGLADVPAEDGQLPVVLAYEPVWAIGTGVNATPEQAQEVHEAIRGILKGLYGADEASGTIIVYGGSVKPENVESLMCLEDVDGALVGGASLKADAFLAIVRQGTEASLRRVG